MSVMEEAFARAGMRRRLTVAGAGVVVQPIARQPIKERLVEDRAAYAVMSDEDLQFERAALEENLESIRIELRLAAEGEVERPRDWRPRAERAGAMVKGRLALCRLELEKRERAAAEERRVRHRAAAERHNAEVAAQAERRRLAHEEKLERIEASNRKTMANLRAFVRRASALLPAETVAAIWAEVNAKEVADAS